MGWEWISWLRERLDVTNDELSTQHLGVGLMHAPWSERQAELGAKRDMMTLKDE